MLCAAKQPRNDQHRLHLPESHYLTENRAVLLRGSQFVHASDLHPSVTSSLATSRRSHWARTIIGNLLIAKSTIRITGTPYLSKADQMIKKDVGVGEASSDLNLARGFGSRPMSLFPAYGHDAWAVSRYRFWGRDMLCSATAERSG